MIKTNNITTFKREVNELKSFVVEHCVGNKEKYFLYFYYNYGLSIQP